MPLSLFEFNAVAVVFERPWWHATWTYLVMRLR
jgi:hypothetical protein